MKIPYKIRLMDKFKRPPRYIILHDITCQAPSAEALRIDSEVPQINKLRTIMYTKNMEPDLNYHFVVERVGEDYEAIMGRPLAVMCNYPDIPSPFNNSFHVCVMGSFEYDIPDRREYQKLAYNILSPMIRFFNIGIDRIYTHKEISTNKEIACPGTFFDKNLVINQLKSMLINK